MNRREVLKRTTIYMGGVLSAPTIAAIMNGCGPGRTPDWQPGFFTPEQAMTIEDIAERILPKTDTPGAKDAGVPQFIESMVGDIFDQENRELFMSGLDDFGKQCQEKFGKAFVKCTEEQQYEFLNPLNEEVVARVIEGRANNEESDPPFFQMVKELTIVGFFNSEIGATQVAQYEAIPGDFNGCLSLEEAGGRAWAT